MAYSDSLIGEIVARLNPAITTTEGGIVGERSANHTFKTNLTDGAGTDQATGFFSSTFTATTGGITISLADSADPLGAAGDDAPTSDPKGLLLRALMIENQDSTNFITIQQGTNALNNWNTGILNLSAGGVYLHTFPAGKTNPMNDGVDDEILITADTANVTTKITYIFG